MSARLRDLISALDSTDPNDVAAVHRVVAGAFEAGFQGFYEEARAHSPAFAAEWSGISSRGGTTTAYHRLRRCLDCGKVCSPGAMGMHLKARNGHSGWEDAR